MQTADLKSLQHEHDFHTGVDHGERNTRRVMILTAGMMVVEILAGWLSGSMALLADGMHMGTHVAAFGITLFAYSYARKHAGSERFTFGTGKVGDLGGYTSAIVLAVVALLMAWECVQRLMNPVAIHFNEAIAVAVIGLIVNLISAYLLKDHHHHGPDGENAHTHGHPVHTDQNLRAAYLHVLADATTSITAIAALSTGKYLGWTWCDPVMGIVGAVLISFWAYGLLRSTSEVLLDGKTAPHLIGEIRETIEKANAQIADLHVWQVGVGRFSAIVSLVAEDPKPPQYYKNLLREHTELVHLTIEVHARGATSQPLLTAR